MTQICASVDENATCNMCKKELRSGEFFYDVKVITSWAWLCQHCYEALGPQLQLGTGLGQEYDSKTNIKTRG